MTKTAELPSGDAVLAARPGGVPYGKSGPTFGGLLASLVDPSSSAAPPGRVSGIGVQPAIRHGRASQAHGRGTTGGAHSAASGNADQALHEAMSRESVPASWEASLRYIMHKESGGNVDVKNPQHSARGLFQLTAANYHYNPHGKTSFGDGVEEAQGGIRYIKSRYGTAQQAAAFWQQHRWY